ncbi:MAG: ABC transporter permease [Cyclobacteriaceae bacterium]
MATTIIDSSKKGINLNFRELYQYRDLFLTLTYRDIRVRYAQTFLGFLWALIQPLATLLIFTLIFGQAIQVDTGGVPYPVFAICGMSAWTYFSFVMSNAGNSVIGAQGMIKKIYFPRLIIPLSKAVVGFVDYAIVCVLLVLMFIFYETVPSSNIIYLPIFIILTVLSALSLGIWLSALTVRYRDFQHLVPFMVQFGVYITPIAFPSELVIERFPNWLSAFYYLNPMAGIVEGLRWSLLGGEFLHTYSYISFSIVLVLFISGLFYFRSVEKTMADIV